MNASRSGDYGQALKRMSRAPALQPEHEETPRRIAALHGVIAQSGPVTPAS